MKLLAWALVLLCVLSFFLRNQFESNVSLDSRLLNEPLQYADEHERKQLPFEDRQYFVDRKFRYELYGMVVSFREHDGDQMLHKSWGDHLNIADVCVVWSDTAQSPFLNQIDFWNGQFTCNVRTSSNEAWQSFNMNQLSNNHLISADPYIRKKITDINIGDQIVIKGWLSEYGNDQGAIRGTSIRRDDTGNGACETIYVEQFEVIREAKRLWHKLFTVSSALLLLMLAWYFFSPYKPRAEKNH